MKVWDNSGGYRHLRPHQEAKAPRGMYWAFVLLMFSAAALLVSAILFAMVLSGRHHC